MTRGRNEINNCPMLSISTHLPHTKILRKRNRNEYSESMGPEKSKKGILSKLFKKEVVHFSEPIDLQYYLHIYKKINTSDDGEDNHPVNSPVQICNISKSKEMPNHIEDQIHESIDIFTGNKEEPRSNSIDQFLLNNKDELDEFDVASFVDLHIASNLIQLPTYITNDRSQYLHGRNADSENYKFQNFESFSDFIKRETEERVEKLEKNTVSYADQASIEKVTDWLVKTRLS